MIVPKERNAIEPQPVTLSKLLLVEGDTPTHFFEALAKELHLEKHVEIRNYGGITQLKLFLKTIASTSSFIDNVSSLGIVRDAETNPQAARQSVDDAVRAANLRTDLPVSVIILPNENSQGMLESLCVDSVSSDDVFSCIDMFFECLDSKNVGLPNGIGRAKHLAQAYLITKNLPQYFPGNAAYKRAWPFTNPIFNGLKTFLRDL